MGADVVGVADGVGGWRQYGVDPGQFSTHLMKNCERLVNSGYFSPTQPAKLLAQSFREMQVSSISSFGKIYVLSLSRLILYPVLSDRNCLIQKGHKE